MDGISGLTGELIVNTLSQIIPLIIVVIVGVVALEFALYNLLTKVFRVRNALAFTLLAPAAIAIVAFMICLLYTSPSPRDS